MSKQNTDHLHLLLLQILENKNKNQKFSNIGDNNIKFNMA